MNRTERRRKIKEDRRLVARGLDTSRRDTLQLAALMRVLHDLAEESRDMGTVAPLMAFLHDNMRIAERTAPRRQLACRKSCSHCCHAWVSARAPEVLFVKSAVPSSGVEAVRISVDRAIAATGMLDPDDRSRFQTPCPLLRDNLCQVYAARPATCRTAVSEDAAICDRALRLGSDEGIPTPQAYIKLRAGYALALAGALKRAGFPATAYELNSALRAAFARPDAEAAWLAGEDVFAGVARDPTGDPFDHPRNRQFYESAWTG